MCGEPKLQRDNELVTVSMLLIFMCRGPPGPRGAVVNEDPPGKPVQTYLQTSSWVPLAQLDWSIRESFMCQHA